MPLFFRHPQLSAPRVATHESGLAVLHELTAPLTNADPSTHLQPVIAAERRHATSDRHGSLTYVKFVGSLGHMLGRASRRREPSQITFSDGASSGVVYVCCGQQSILPSKYAGFHGMRAVSSDHDTALHHSKHSHALARMFNLCMSWMEPTTAIGVGGTPRW